MTGRDGERGAGAESAPVFTVVAGNPGPEELAAVTAVLSTMTEGANGFPAPAEPVADEWSRAQRQGRAPLVPGPGAWNRAIR